MTKDIKEFINFRIKECSESISHRESISYDFSFISMSFAIEAYRDILIYIGDKENEK
jgi:hypothetical protein